MGADATGGERLGATTAASNAVGTNMAGCFTACSKSANAATGRAETADANLRGSLRWGIPGARCACLSARGFSVFGSGCVLELFAPLARGAIVVSVAGTR